MLCEMCNKNEANVHVTKIINGVKQELNLCQKCAKEMGNIGMNLTGDIKFASPFTFQNILSGIMDYLDNHAKDDKYANISCKNCGMTYDQFRKEGLVGCSECYKNFSTTLMPVIKRVQGNIEHVGKIPKKAGKSIIEKKKLIKLKQELQNAIAVEEYEKAAEIRDMIKEIEKEK